jgi:RND family efflux transporter MFP subunit
MNRKALNFLVSGIVILGIAWSCSGDKTAKLDKLKKQRETIDSKINALESEVVSEKDSLDPGKFRLVGVTEIKPEAFNHYIKVQGRLDGDQNVAVFADVPGTVKAKYANVGQKVAKGQVLAQIDDEQFRLQLENLKTQYRFAADMYEKQKRLWDQKIGSEVQFLQSQTTKESLEQQISVLEEQLEKYKIKSPVSGTIEEADIKPGSIVSPDPRAPAFRVVAFRELTINAEVSESYSAMVNKGDKLVIHFPDLDKQVESKIDFVSSYIDPVNRTFEIESNIENSIPGMKANMVAVVHINDYHSEKSIAIPMNVIMSDLTGNYVYVVKEKDNYHGAFRQPVVIGKTYNGIAEILSGLEPSSRVITTGFRELIEGEYIRFEGASADYLSRK